MIQRRESFETEKMASVDRGRACFHAAAGLSGNGGRGLIGGYFDHRKRQRSVQQRLSAAPGTGYSRYRGIFSGRCAPISHRHPAPVSRGAALSPQDLYCGGKLQPRPIGGGTFFPGRVSLPLFGDHPAGCSSRPHIQNSGSIQIGGERNG